MPVPAKNMGSKMLMELLSWEILNSLSDPLEMLGRDPSLLLDHP